MQIFRNLCALFLIITSTNVLASFSLGNQSQILFDNGNLEGEINLSTLEIRASNKTGDKKILLADSPINLGKIRDLTCREKNASWYYTEHDLKISLLLQDNQLIFSLETQREQDLIFPRTGQGKEMQAIIYPNSEGLFIPQDDKFWQKQLVNSELNVHEQMSMPFWGHYCDSNVVTYILHDDLYNTFQFKLLNDKKLFAQLKHHFKKIGDTIPPYHFTIVMGTKSPITPALEYKKHLRKTILLKTLTNKSSENKNIEKLYGALHIYLWGDGRTKKAIDKLQELGLKNLWLGYDQDPRTHKFLVTPEVIQKATAAGYLIGPYDSFHTMEDSEKAESINAIFDNLYPEACIINENGKANIGFGGKGCHISSEALALQQPKNKTIYNRIDKFLSTGINSYFLDCDATGELFDDFSASHPMNKTQDRLNRIERMHYLVSNKKLVLGSETAVWWSIPYLAFAHGNLSVYNSIHWPFSKSKNYGRWWPQERPQFFFKPIHAPSDYIKTKYDPRYRIPLFQTVFHQSIITTDRWELTHMKIANAYATRELLELLYGVPSIWSLDLQDINKYSTHIKKLSSFFAPIHKAIATEELKDFRWLDNNRQVQQTIFGNKMIKLTANFSNKIYGVIKPNSIEVEWLENGKKEYYTPPRPSNNKHSIEN